MNFALRISRFGYVVLAYIGGFLGIGVGLFVQMIILANLKSFGASYLSPYLPVTNYSRSHKFILKPLWQTERRPDFLNTKRKYAENNVTMKWKNKDIKK